MVEVTYYGVDTGLFEGGEDLVGRILENVDDPPRLEDGDVVVSSKVVSLAEERHVDLESISVSPRAERIAERAGLDEKEAELVLRESTVVGAIPVADLAADHLMEQTTHEEGADQAIEDLPSLLVTVRNGRLCTNAGVDLSNSPEGMATLLPSDPNASARRIREALQERADVDVAVILTDSEVSHRGGSVDIAIGCSGIKPIDRNFGASDLYDNPKLGGVDLIADEIAAGAVLLTGQAAERTPVVIVRGLEYDSGDGIEPDAEFLRDAIVPTLAQSIRVKLAERVPVF
ncbi:coenzyme F420-0:L-glutamate ligase [Halopenitus sp. H-Gu1]|uniref:coenzyme F420-0:L-glutamate ligase n=1 Tax=Halopenitus sp. H-Gu1 TaxID=3242697 RepID=UPI00359E16B4